MRSLGDRLRQVRIDRLVEVEGPLGPQPVDARCSDALNLAAITGAPVVVSPPVMDDCARRQQGDSAEARLLRMALAVPQVRVERATA
jgi:bifunctional DNase/RNase